MEQTMCWPHSFWFDESHLTIALPRSGFLLLILAPFQHCAYYSPLVNKQITPAVSHAIHTSSSTTSRLARVQCSPPPSRRSGRFGVAAAQLRPTNATNFQSALLSHQPAAHRTPLATMEPLPYLLPCSSNMPLLYGRPCPRVGRDVTVSRIRSPHARRIHHGAGGLAVSFAPYPQADPKKKTPSPVPRAGGVNKTYLAFACIPSVQVAC
ncbi:hypothetical protein K431DRAFT_64039 [Polychaeton citri CBS 116435]|uniref:Uncharacterized protein n=1 Tax=Polychaeton citri CBS 116435 TaxID=1314669 RepID=A0A9P4QBK4_9PEZI|nr:hypothetical protein K431DRAFT_64039 [Polychaeton citri CBS 116435]